MKRVLISVLVLTSLMVMTSFLYSTDIGAGVRFGKVSNMPYPGKTGIGPFLGFSLSPLKKELKNFWLEFSWVIILSSGDEWVKRCYNYNNTSQNLFDLNLIYQLPKIEILKTKVRGLIGVGIGYLEAWHGFIDPNLSSYYGTPIATETEDKNSFTKNLIFGLNIFPSDKGDAKGLFIRPEFRVYRTTDGRMIKTFMVTIGALEAF